MRAVVFTGAGGNEVVALQERPDPVCASDDVIVRVRYAGLNPADVSQRKGHYPAPAGFPPDIPGLEVAGTVERCGSRVIGLAVGDRVFGLVGGGGLADRVAVHERCVARVPESLDERQAAAVPEAFITAHDAIRSQAGLTPGEVLLAHGAAGGVGSAALQIALALGARALGTTRSEPAAVLVRELGAEPIPDEDFAEAVLAATDGHGADVICETVGAPHFPGNLDALASKGRIVIVGVGSGQRIDLPLRALMGKRASVRGTMLRARSLEDKALAVRDFEREVVPLLASERLRPVIDSIHDAEMVADAFDRLEGRGKTGKVLLDFGA